MTKTWIGLHSFQYKKENIVSFMNIIGSLRVEQKHNSFIIQSPLKMDFPYVDMLILPGDKTKRRL